MLTESEEKTKKDFQPAMDAIDLNANRKKTRTPRSADSIMQGALNLPLKDRVDLLNALKSSIDEEVETLQAAAEQAKKIANGS